MERTRKKNGLRQILTKLPGKVNAALFFVGDHAIFRYSESKDTWIYKHISFETLSRAFTQKTTDSGWLPAGLVRWGKELGGDWYVLYRQPATYNLTMVIGGVENKIETPLPALVMLAYRGKYQVLAMEGEEFSPFARLYKAPLSNIYSHSEVCWGDNTIPVISPETAIRAWELFITSPFNKDLAGGKCRTYSKNVIDLWESLTGQSKFPAEELVPLNVYSPTLEGYIGNLISVSDSEEEDYGGTPLGRLTSSQFTARSMGAMAYFAGEYDDEDDYREGMELLEAEGYH